MWKTIPGFENYEVSSKGTGVRAKSRTITMQYRAQTANRNGKRIPITNFTKTYHKQQKLLKPARVEKRRAVYQIHDANGTRHTFYLSRLVLLTFVGPPRKNQSCALHFPDPDPANCDIANLMWGSQKQNCEHTKIHGNTTRGEKNKHAKLTAQKVKMIRDMKTKGKSLTMIATLFGLHPDYVSALCRRKFWTHIYEKQEGHPKRNWKRV